MIVVVKPNKDCGILSLLVWFHVTIYPIEDPNHRAMIKRYTFICFLLLMFITQESQGEDSFPLFLGDDLTVAESVLGNLLPCAKVVFPLLNEEDLNYLLNKQGSSRCLGSKKWGVFLQFTTNNKIFSIRLNREHAEFEISKHIHGISPSYDSEKIKKICGTPVKEEHNSETQTFFFRCQDVFVEATFLLKSVPNYRKIQPGELITFMVEKNL